MFNISSLLKKFSKNVSEYDYSTKELSAIIYKHTGLEIENTSFEVKQNVLYIDVSPALKNKIFITKKEIMREIQEKISLSLVDIR